MRIVRTVALAALLVLAWATPAAATGAGGRGPTWLPCQNSTGVLVGMVDEVLSYIVSPCAPPRPTDAVIVAYYGPGPALASAEPYPPAGMAGATALSPHLAQAVCLLTSPSTRIVCATIIVDANGRAGLGDPLPTDSPLVSTRIDLGPAYEPPDCAACF